MSSSKSNRRMTKLDKLRIDGVFRDFAGIAVSRQYRWWDLNRHGYCPAGF